MTILLVVVACTLLISAVCSLFEATLYSTRVSTLESVRDKGKHTRAATIFWKMKKDVTAPTSAILILNTVANTAGATVAGMLAAAEFGPGYVPLFSAVLTLAILMFSEIIPKTFGAVHWRALWPHVALPLSAIQRGLRPLVWLTARFSALLIPQQSATRTTEEEVLAMARIAAETGDLSTIELELLHGVFRFDELVCRSVMVPRHEVAHLKRTLTLSEALELTRSTLHTRYPLCEDTFDDPLGIVHVKDFVGLDGDTPIESVLRPVRLVPETMPIPKLLRSMQSSHDHMAIVVDEHGTTVGIVTLENLIEQIVGSVQDEFDSEEPDVLRSGKRTHIVKGATTIERVNRLLSIALPHPANTDTISGLLVQEKGRLLEKGDRVELSGVTIEVEEIVGHRATKLRITLPRAATPSDETA